MIKRKSQIYGQVFIYILATVLISLILVYSYNAIHNFKKRAEDVACLKLKNDIKNSVQGILSDFGSVKRKDVRLCGDYDKICFVETFEPGPLTLPSKVDPIIKDSISSGADKNAFLIEDIAKEAFYVGEISVNPDLLCIEATNKKVSLRLEGKGSHASLSKWN